MFLLVVHKVNQPSSSPSSVLSPAAVLDSVEVVGSEKENKQRFRIKSVR